jgi:hypothetical protein
MKKIALLTISAVLLLLFCNRSRAVATERIWPVMAIDTMKYSRDISREKDILERIPGFVDKVAQLTPTHIAVSTPYNEEFLPVLKKWVSEARSRQLSVWFRGNWSEWEGWFGYQKFKTPQEHHQRTYAFIISHPELFRDGDIFTPAPEAENGMIGDPRRTAGGPVTFRQFLVDSYANCVSAFSVIGKKVSCGYFSTNGDVAREILDKETVAKIGHVVVIDHYVKTPRQLAIDIGQLNQKLQAPVVLGEIGAPIPDIHGAMTEIEQATYMQEVFSQLFKIKGLVGGVNYWTAFGGSTALYNRDGSARSVTEVIKEFYNPGVFKGTTVNTLGDTVPNVLIKNQDGSIAFISDTHGNFKATLPALNWNFKATKSDYQTTEWKAVISRGDELQHTFILMPLQETWVYRLRRFIQSMIKTMTGK